MATLARFTGTDENGLPVEADFDLEKPVLIDEIPEETEWKLDTLDEANESDSVEFVGGRKKH